MVGDLSQIGGSATQAFFDDGTNGDAVAGNNVFSYGATVAAATTPGAKSLPVVIADAQERMARRHDRAHGRGAAGSRRSRSARFRALRTSRRATATR